MEADMNYQDYKKAKDDEQLKMMREQERKKEIKQIKLDTLMVLGVALLIPVIAEIIYIIIHMR
jgi:1,4-dihydroxy-2-naphthoate octaprenyltransferase